MPKPTLIQTESEKGLRRMQETVPHLLLPAANPKQVPHPRLETTGMRRVDIDGALVSLSANGQPHTPASPPPPDEAPGEIRHASAG